MLLSVPFAHAAHNFLHALPADENFPGRWLECPGAGMVSLGRSDSSDCLQRTGTAKSMWFYGLLIAAIGMACVMAYVAYFLWSLSQYPDED